MSTQSRFVLAALCLGLGCGKSSGGGTTPDGAVAGDAPVPADSGQRDSAGVANVDAVMADAGDALATAPDASAAVWPPGATKLVAENQGGGFTPAPPAGSTCLVGAALYTVTVAGKVLAYRECQPTGSSGAYAWKEGQRALTDTEYGALTAALGKVTIASRQICGADKPVLTLKVTTASGDTDYADSFYSCMKKGLYVDNIDGVFAFLRGVPKS